MRYPFNKKNIQKKIDVSASRNYSIMIQCNSGIEPLQNLLKKYGGFYVVTDANLSKQQEGFLSSLQKHSRYKGITITKPGEKSKEWHILHSLLTDMLNADMDRNSLVIAFGGGVIGDLAGLAASLFMRGVDCLMVPTSLLAMVDSSVGGKTGINHTLGKNLIGTFMQPVHVYIDINFLSTLPKRELLNGLAEIVKYGYIFDKHFLDYLTGNWQEILALDHTVLKEIISYCCSAKALIVEADEHEKGLRMLLNFGHTFGHALETFFEYEEMLHGEAVNLGMILANEYAEQKGFVYSGFAEDRVLLHKKLASDTGLISRWDTDKLTGLIKKDKKVREGKIQLILPDKNGVSVHNNIDENELNRFLSDIKPKLIEQLRK